MQAGTVLERSDVKKDSSCIFGDQVADGGAFALHVRQLVADDGIEALLEGLHGVLQRPQGLRLRQPDIPGQAGILLWAPRDVAGLELHVLADQGGHALALLVVEPALIDQAHALLVVPAHHLLSPEAPVTSCTKRHTLVLCGSRQGSRVTCGSAHPTQPLPMLEATPSAMARRTAQRSGGGSWNSAC